MEQLNVTSGEHGSVTVSAANIQGVHGSIERYSRTRWEDIERLIRVGEWYQFSGWRSQFGHDMRAVCGRRRRVGSHDEQFWVVLNWLGWVING